MLRHLLASRTLVHARSAAAARSALQQLSVCSDGGEPGAVGITAPPALPSISSRAFLRTDSSSWTSTSFAASAWQTRSMSTAGGGSGAGADAGADDLEKVTLLEVPLDEAVGAIDQACGAAETAALAAAYQDSWLVASWMVTGLSYVHDTMDWPWWTSVMACNFALKTLMFPVSVMMQKFTAKTMLMTHDSLHARRIQESMMKTTDARLYDRLRLELTEEMARVEARHGNMVANTLKGPALMIINSVVFISFLSALRSMVLMGVPSLHFGGAAWFTDLTVPDPYLGLPLLCAAVTFAQVSFNMGMSDGAPMTATTRGIKMAMQGATLLFVPFGAYVTSAVALLWVSNTGFNVLQGFVLRSPWFRRTVGLPTLDELRAMSAKVNLVTGAKPAAGAPATAAAAPGSSAAASTAVPAQPAAAALSGSSPRSPPSAFTLPSGQKLYAQPPKRGSLRGGAGSSVSRGGGGGRTYATLAAAQLLLLRHQAANAKSALIVMRQS